jgi:Fe2+ transport system protein FeoA
MTDTSVPLGCCRPGEAVRVDSLGADTAFAGRLRAMGIHDGVRLEILRDGATMIVQVDHGSRLCLRGDDVSQVWVSPLPVTARHASAYLTPEGADARI